MTVQRVKTRNTSAAKRPDPFMAAHTPAVAIFRKGWAPQHLTVNSGQSKDPVSVSKGRRVGRF
jgi:hypothetical protein